MMHQFYIFLFSNRSQSQKYNLSCFFGIVFLHTLLHRAIFFSTPMHIEYLCKEVSRKAVFTLVHRVTSTMFFSVSTHQ